MQKYDVALGCTFAWSSVHIDTNTKDPLTQGFSDSLLSITVVSNVPGGPKDQLRAMIQHI